MTRRGSERITITRTCSAKKAIATFKTKRLPQSRTWNAHTDDRRHRRRCLDLYPRTSQRFGAQGSSSNTDQLWEIAVRGPGPLDGRPHFDPVSRHRVPAGVDAGIGAGP